MRRIFLRDISGKQIQQIGSGTDGPAGMNAYQITLRGGEVVIADGTKEEYYGVLRELEKAQSKRQKSKYREP